MISNFIWHYFILSEMNWHYYSRLNNSSCNIYVLIPRTHEYVALPGKKDFTGKIK